MRIGEDTEGEGDEPEDRDRAGRAKRHHRGIAAPGADHRHDGDDDRRGKRQNQSIMSKLDDHCWDPSPFQTPCAFILSATSLGI